MPKRSFGQIRRRASKRWQAFYTGPDTALHYAPSTFETKLDAEGWLTDERRLIAAGRWVAPARRQAMRDVLDLTAYADAWLADRPLKPRTRQLYRSLLDHHILPALGGEPLAGLTAVDIRRWHTAAGSSTPTATAHAYALLRTILGSAVDDELLRTNPGQPHRAAADYRQPARAVRTDDLVGVVVRTQVRRAH